MNHGEFESLIAQGYERLPEWVRKRIRNVAILVEDRPSRAVRARERLEPDETLLGYYQGVPLSERGEGYGVGLVLPDTITLYRLPILEAAEESHIAVADVIADTLWHECAHHFGIDEEGVRAREKERSLGDFRGPDVV